METLMPTQFPIRASDDELTPAAGSLSRAPLVPRLRPHHLGVSVPDLELAIDWYGRMLGFELESREAIKAIPASVAFLRRKDFRIELFRVPGAKSLPRDRQIPNLDLRTHGNKHLCFEVPAYRRP
jgi:methylmalonyl-CoA/ethylmalonyl-CoA epimerase